LQLAAGDRAALDEQGCEAAGNLDEAVLELATVPLKISSPGSAVD